MFPARDKRGRLGYNQTRRPQNPESKKNENRAHRSHLKVGKRSTVVR